ncbi:MAG: ATP-dependent Clp protease proteolytic subunit [Chrysiogenetes bacterium]|nr:ATP-dependent Clp protease proteolytic subunit [Chrysiogenetes bacterium]
MTTPTRSAGNARSARLGMAQLLAMLALALAVPALSLAQSGTPAPAGDAGVSATDTAPRGRVITGTIDDEIGFATSAYVMRLIERAEKENADALVLEINTFGGRVDAAVAIRDALLDTKVPTVAWIHRRAISAGALISFACDKIVISPGGTMGAATPIQIAPGSQEATPVSEKYVSYFRQEMRATAEVNGRDGDIAEAMVDADREVAGLSEKGKLLTLTTDTAMEHKIADAIGSSMDEVLTYLKLRATPETVARTWAEDLVGFLTSSAVSGMLFMAMIALGYMEYQAPGFGAFGYGAILCFLLLFGSHYLVNLAGWEEMLLFGVGVILLLVEIFVTPGFGVLGALGGLSIFAAMVLLLLAGDFSDFEFSNPFAADAAMRVLVSTALSIGIILFLMSYLPAKKAPGALVLAHVESGDAGYRSHEHEVTHGDLVGMEGEALSPLRPSGRARLNGRRVDVESEGEFIDKGDRVRVLRVQPGKVIVRKV